MLGKHVMYFVGWSALVAEMPLGVLDLDRTMSFDVSSYKRLLSLGEKEKGSRGLFRHSAVQLFASRPERNY